MGAYYLKVSGEFTAFPKVKFYDYSIVLVHKDSTYSSFCISCLLEIYPYGVTRTLSEDFA